MAAFSTKGLTVWLQKVPGATPLPVSITSATNSKPSVLTVGPADIAKVKNGDLVTVNGTGMAALDTKSFIATSVNTPANMITLLGSDASSATASGTT